MNKEKININDIKDRDVPDIWVGWIWYIFIMLVLFIANDRIIGWIAATIFFKVWKTQKKIKYIKELKWDDYAKNIK